jgi:hypothetical protein
MQNAESLAKLKKDALTELCRQRGVSGYSKMKKDDMIAAILAAENNSSAGKAAADAAAKPSAKKKPAPAAKKPVKKAAAEAAKPVKKAAAKAAKPVKKAAAEKPAPKSGELASFCAALANLWGVAPVQQIISVYARQHGGESVSEADIAALAGDAFVVENGELVHPSVAGNAEELKALREKKAKYPYYVPSADEMAAYIDPAFRQSSHAFSAMTGFFVRTFGVAEDRAADATGKILGFLNSENGIDPLMASLGELGIKFGDSAQFRSFGVLLDNLRNSARLWELNGHTAAEARNFEENRGPIHVIKVGRNDPCPCGSGKKYKKCCGR